MSTTWRVIVVSVGVLAVLAIGLSVYTLASMGGRIDDHLAAVARGPAGPQGPAGPIGPQGLQGQAGVSGCAIDPNSWNQFVLELGGALTAAEAGSAIFYNGRPPQLVCG